MSDLESVAEIMQQFGATLVTESLRAIDRTLTTVSAQIDAMEPDNDYERGFRDGMARACEVIGDGLREASETLQTKYGKLS